MARTGYLDCKLLACNSVITIRFQVQQMWGSCQDGIGSVLKDRASGLSEKWLLTNPSHLWKRNLIFPTTLRQKHVCSQEGNPFLRVALTERFWIERSQSQWHNNYTHTLKVCDIDGTSMSQTRQKWTSSQELRKKNIVIFLNRGDIQQNSSQWRNGSSYLFIVDGLKIYFCSNCWYHQWNCGQETGNNWRSIVARTGKSSRHQKIAH